MTGPATVMRFDLLLVHMTRQDSIAELATRTLKGDIIVRAGAEPSQGLIFDVITRYQTRYNTLPDPAAVETEVVDFLGRHPSMSTFSEAVHRAIHRFKVSSSIADNRSVPMVRELIQNISREFVFVPKAREVLKSAENTNQFTGLAARLTELEATQRAAAGGLSLSNLLDSDDIDASGERAQTAIPWLDARFGGGTGVVTGCLIGIIGGQGSGKTTFGLQLAVNQALSGRHSLLALAEEGLSLQVRCKIAGCALGVPWPSIERATPDKFSDKVKATVEALCDDKELAYKKMKNINTYLHVFDMVRQGATGSESIIAEIMQLTAAGKKPAFAYVDWAGMIATEAAERKKTTKESEIKVLSYDLASFAAKENMNIALAQQMAGAAYQKGPFARNDHYCAEDCRGFAQPMKYVFVINAPDPKSSCSLFIVAKSRDDARGEAFPVRLRGDIPRFDDLSERWELRGRRFTQRTADAQQATT